MLLKQGRTSLFAILDCCSKSLIQNGAWLCDNYQPCACERLNFVPTRIVRPGSARTRLGKANIVKLCKSVEIYFKVV